MPRSRSWSLVVALLITAPGTGWTDHGHDPAERLGSVHFATSCTEPAQALFDRGVALLHSFAYPEASQAFHDVADTDGRCAMAWWGVAMSNLHIIWGPPTAEEFAAGRAAAERAASMAEGATPRERDFIAAIDAYYKGDAPHAVRMVAFEQAMALAAANSPDDHEAAIFHALALLGVAYNSPPDKSFARQKQAAAILNRLLPLEPDHPGIAHYMIHSFDYPELAELALPAARAYAKIAPSAPHALHMPSHIFTRLGMWQESIESNLASARTAQAVMARTRPGATAFEALHAMDYLEYAYLQTGQDAKARALADSAARVTSFDAPGFQAGYALAAIPARYHLERRDWKASTALTVRPDSYPWAKYPYDEAITHFARAVGGARSGDLATAREALKKLETIQLGLKGQKGFDWATQVEIQCRTAAAWIAYAEKRNADALATMRSAADLEDGTDKHPVTPGSILPAREQLADLLIELGKPAEALAQYEASLRKAPARFNTYLGAARAAEKAGRAATAKDYRDRLTALCGGAVPNRVALAGE